MELDARKAGQTLIATVGERRIDASVALEFKEAVRRHAAELGGNPVILDLSAVEFLDSSGLGAVVSVMKLLAPDQKLELAGLTPPVAKVFRLTRMDTIFTIHDRPPNPLQRAV